MNQMCVNNNQINNMKINNNMHQKNNSNNYFQNNKEKNNNNKEYKMYGFEEFPQFFSEVGLKNVGLTCYMNSTLQLLLHIPELNYFFIKIYPNQKEMLKKINKEADTRGQLSKEYNEIVKSIYENNNRNNPLAPRNLNNLFDNRFCLLRFLNYLLNNNCI
jgi:ubiquitin C-terminal hydrolase